MMGSYRQFATRGERPLRLSLLGVAAAAGMVMSTPASAVKIYDEDSSGDLSNSGLSPTAFNLVLGNNVLEGWTGRVDGAIDRDYFTFTLGSGQALESIFFSGSAIGLSFIGVQPGSQVSVDPAAADATGLLGWYHYSSGDTGTDILDNIGVAAAGSTGFTAPLGPGTYAFWIQEASPGDRVAYRFNFVVGEFVGEVPEPTTWAMMLLGFGFAGLALRRSRTPATATS